MVRSDKGAAGVMFTMDTESGFDQVVFITASYGLGETVVQGAVNPDEYFVHKPIMEMDKFPIIRKVLGSKKIKIDNFDCAVFDGKYVTGDVDEAYLDKIEQARNDASKVKSQAVSAIIDLYNN